MTAFDDELAALHALDALEAGEQADAELLLGTFPIGLTDASAALAETTAAEPPAALRAATLGQAFARRPAGRPVGGVQPCAPLDAFLRTVVELHELLATLSDDDWNLRAHPEHGRVHDLIAHLVGVERLSARWLDPDEYVPDVPDHVMATRPVVAELADVPSDQVARLWHQAALAVADAARGGDPARSVPFHDMTTTVDGFLIIRTFELWAHAMDICTATGRPLLRLDPERMAAMSHLLMDSVPLALAYRAATAPGRTARFVLTGSAGGCYTVPLHPGDTPGEPDVTVVADPVDLCRVAALRLRPEELAVTVEGDRELGQLVLANLGALARD